MNSRLNETEEQIRYLEDRIMKITQSEQWTERQIKKKKERKQHIRSMVGQYKVLQHFPHRVPGGQEKRRSKMYFGIPTVAQWVKNPTNIHEDAGLITSLAQWVKDPALPKFQHRSKMQHRSNIAVAVM